MRKLALLVFVVFGILVVISLALAPLGFAQRRPLPPAPEDVVLEAPALALARICRHEAGFPRRRRDGWELTDDCAAIDAVISRVRAALSRAQHREVTYPEAVYAYSRGRVYDRSRTDAACDVAWLDAYGTEPACWRGGVPWARRREAWLVLLELAQAVHDGEVTHHCAVPPLHWGCGPVQTARGCRDHERAARAGWVEVSCGRTRNTFYAAPTSAPAP